MNLYTFINQSRATFIFFLFYPLLLVISHLPSHTAPSGVVLYNIYTLLPELENKGFPLVQQTAYQHGVSCLDAMFSAL